MMRLRWILLLAGLLLVASAIAGVAQPRFGHSATTPPAGKTITVNGNGSVTTVPDRATFDFSIETHAKTATAALTQNSTDAAAVIAALKAAGVTSANLQTSQVSLQPQSSQDGTDDHRLHRLEQRHRPDNRSRARQDRRRRGRSGRERRLRAEPRRLRPKLALPRRAAQGGRRREAEGAGARRRGRPQPRRRAVGSEGGSATPLPIADKMSAVGSVPIEAGTQEIQASVTITYSAT